MKQVVVDEEDVKKLMPAFNTKIGSYFIKPVLKLMALDKVNALYGRCCAKTGHEFTELLLKDLNIKYLVTNPAALTKFPDCGYITVSNHPFGALDGIVLITMMGSIRPDYKVMVNSVLTYIDAMSPNFIAVQPYSNKKGSKVNMLGIKESMRHLKDGHPLGFFPAGGVSKIKGNLRIEDNPWAPNILRLIKQMNMPVVPIYFHGHNSLFFNILGLISWKLRSLRLPWEVFLKKNTTVRISIGDIISVEEQHKYESLESLGVFLRDKTYQAAKNVI
ncbi:MAG: lysophospholipid acyltransferase family protein [Bacteroidales bacterium]|nr:lysophospholipid acyltransferase family protein [Bacteroidales bacterium]